MSVSKYSLAHLPAEVILRDLPKLVARDRATLAEILAHISEVDSRRLYVPAAYSSTVAYCMGELRLSEDSALKRIRAARAASQFPALYEAIADGRLSLTTVVLLNPHLTDDSCDDLIIAAEGKTKSEIGQLVARLKQAELPAVETVVPESLSAPEIAPPPQVVPEPPMATLPSAPATQVVPEPPMATFGPVVPPRVALRINIDQETQELMRCAQDLLSHQVPSGSPAEVLKRALKSLIRDLKRTKFAATDRPQAPRKRAASRTRHIPAHVKRAVRERDGFQCTFVSASGRRCESRTRLEFDHVQEFARGGEATVDGIRLRCRVHNQYTAEQTFGAQFMNRKREQARGTPLGPPS